MITKKLDQIEEKLILDGYELQENALFYRAAFQCKNMSI